MRLTFSEQVAAVRLGLILGDELPDIATMALVEGYDSPALATLAGQPTAAYDPSENRRLWQQALDELGMVEPEVLEAAGTLVQTYARMVVARDMAPREGAVNVLHVVDGASSAEPTTMPWADLRDSLGVHRVIYYYYERDECQFLDTTSEEIDDLILREFERILRSARPR